MKLTQEQKRIMLDEFEEIIQSWIANHDDESETKETYKEDRRDLRKIYKFIKDDKLEKALDIACGLDTIIRDLIPCDVWDLLEDGPDVVESSDQLEDINNEPHMTICRRVSKWATDQLEAENLRVEIEDLITKYNKLNVYGVHGKDRDKTYVLVYQRKNLSCG